MRAIFTKNLTIIIVLLGAAFGLSLWYLGVQENISHNSEDFQSLAGKTYAYANVGQNPYDEEDENPYYFSDFFLTFATTSGGNVSGWWSGTWHNASRVTGCIEEDEPCFVGRARGNSAIVKFNSCYAGGEGEARITYNKADDSIRWEVTKFPEGECYIPEEAILK